MQISIKQFVVHKLLLVNKDQSQCLSFVHSETGLENFSKHMYDAENTDPDILTDTMQLDNEMMPLVDIERDDSHDSFDSIQFLAASKLASRIAWSIQSLNFVFISLTQCM